MTLPEQAPRTTRRQRGRGFLALIAVWALAVTILAAAAVLLTR